MCKYCDDPAFQKQCSEAANMIVAALPDEILEDTPPTIRVTAMAVVFTLIMIRSSNRLSNEQQEILGDKFSGEISGDILNYAVKAIEQRLPKAAAIN